LVKVVGVRVLMETKDLLDHKVQLVKLFMLVNKDLLVLKVFKDLLAHGDLQVTKVLLDLKEILDHKVKVDPKDLQVYKDLKELLVKREILDPKVRVDLKVFKVR